MAALLELLQRYHMMTASLAVERRYAARAVWQQISPSDFANVELRDAAKRTSGYVTAYRVPASENGQTITVEALWLVDSGRAAVAGTDGVFWTDAGTIETALHRWASGVARGARTQPR